MRRPLLRSLASLLVLAPAAFAAGAPDRAVGNLLDARTAAGAAAVFDGLRAAPPAVAVPAGTFRRTSAALSAPTTPVALDATRLSAAASVPGPKDPGPTPARGISDGKLGLYDESGFELGTGRCEACRAPREGKWYFLDEVIATPKSGPPALVWIGSHELVEGATLSEDGTRITLKDGSSLPFALTPKIASNRSYYDATSLAFLRGRTLRVRGEYADVGGVRTLVARTIWPEDWRLDPAKLGSADAASADDVDKLVAADKGGPKGPFQAELLWEKPGAARDWDGKAVMGFMLNGAQGDDDESLAGHFSFFTGVYPAGGSMADWMFDNFYSMDTVSEKGIVASLVPLDKYMADLNSGQSWYRPTDMLVLVVKDPRAPLRLQEKFKDQYARYYAHDVVYDRTHKTCAALIVDPLKEEGWRVPEKGRTPAPVAKVIEALIGLKDKEAARKIYDTLREEPTRVFPRAAFDGAAGDLLSLAGADGAEPVSRELTPLERQVQEDLLAILFVRLPQIPSSRAFGRDPAGGVYDYFQRTPRDRSKWKTAPTVPRPFPPPH